MREEIDPRWRDKTKALFIERYVLYDLFRWPFLPGFFQKRKPVELFLDNTAFQRLSSCQADINGEGFMLKKMLSPHAQT